MKRKRSASCAEREPALGQVSSALLRNWRPNCWCARNACVNRLFVSTILRQVSRHSLSPLTTYFFPISYFFSVKFIWNCVLFICCGMTLSTWRSDEWNRDRRLFSTALYSFASVEEEIRFQYEKSIRSFSTLLFLTKNHSALHLSVPLLSRIRLYYILLRISTFPIPLLCCVKRERERNFPFGGSARRIRATFSFFFHVWRLLFTPNNNKICVEQLSSSGRRKKESHILMRRYILLRLDAPFICLYAESKKKEKKISLAGRTLYYRMNEQVLVFLFLFFGVGGILMRARVVT